jgi:hypothetical protein|tara:strand:+ start:526 stop:1305 length:780 start_codon:yes stop_codon:yes gene_type:complete
VSLFKKIMPAIFLVASICALTVYSTYNSIQVIPSDNKYLLSQPDKVSAYYPVNERNAIKSSVGSSVHVVSGTSDGTIISLSTGTYIQYKDRFYILTTAHGIIGECENVAIVYFDRYAPCKSLVINNKALDYSLIEIDEIDFRKPIKVLSGFSKNQAKYQLMDKVYYTGYPNSSGPLTFGGTISGFDEYGYIYVHSYAWAGSSGAGVFDSKGKLVGLVMAIDVGTSEYGVAVLEDIIIVIPIDMIDWAPLFFPKGQNNEQ